jgi:hypothetical protein
MASLPAAAAAVVVLVATTALDPSTATINLVSWASVSQLVLDLLTVSILVDVSVVVVVVVEDDDDTSTAGSNGDDSFGGIGVIPMLRSL